MAGVFYFLLIRPQQRRARAQRSLTQSLDVGDEVVTIGGIHGTISDVDDEFLTVEVDNDVHIQFLRSAIARKMVFDDEEVDDEGASDDYEDEADHAGAGTDDDKAHEGPWFEDGKGADQRKEADEKK
jgi:preprotein translocase subunit YajC